MLSQRIKQILQQLKSFLPRPLPTGMSQFNSWVEDILRLTGLPDNLSTRRAAASLIIQLQPTVGWIPMRKAAALLLKAAANQVALQVLKDPSSEPQAVQTAPADLGSEA